MINSIKNSDIKIYQNILDDNSLNIRIEFSDDKLIWKKLNLEIFSKIINNNLNAKLLKKNLVNMIYSCNFVLTKSLVYDFKLDLNNLNFYSYSWVLFDIKNYINLYIKEKNNFLHLYNEELISEVWEYLIKNIDYETNLEDTIEKITNSTYIPKPFYYYLTEDKTYLKNLLLFTLIYSLVFLFIYLNIYYIYNNLYLEYMLVLFILYFFSLAYFLNKIYKKYVFWYIDIEINNIFSSDIEKSYFISEIINSKINYNLKNIKIIFFANTVEKSIIKCLITRTIILSEFDIPLLIKWENLLNHIHWSLSFEDIINKLYPVQMFNNKYWVDIEWWIKIIAENKKDLIIYWPTNFLKK